jgi:hypothetical protein
MNEVLASVLIVTVGVSLYHFLEWGYYKIEDKFYEWKHQEEITKFEEYIKSIETITKAPAKKTTKKK